MTDQLEDTGGLDVLNCFAGHISIKFDRNDPDDTAKAKRIVTDMLKRGYTILVETPDGTRKVNRFDPNTDSYIVEEPPTETAPKKTRKLPMRKTRATGIGPTAGG